MLKQFMRAFALTAGSVQGSADGCQTIGDVMVVLGGCTFGGGLYRLHTPTSSGVASSMSAAAFPEYEFPLRCFGFDWLGRQFALDPRRGGALDPEVLLLEPGTGEALEVPVPISAFHDEELVNYTDAALASNFFAEWQSKERQELPFDKCVGYKVPLFLGGEDAISNLEITDIDVYWSLMCQLRLATRSAAPGTSVRDITIGD